MVFWLPRICAIVSALAWMSGCSLLAGKGQPEYRPDPIGAALSKILELHGHAGAIVYSLDRNEILFEANADSAFLPASNMKLITTAAALDILGEDFTYTTELLSTALPSAEGRLHGDLIIKGAGDPSFGGRPSCGTSAEPLEQWASSLREAGVRQIEGNVIGYGGLLKDAGFGKGWSWDDEPYGFSARLSGLCFSENSIQFSIFYSEPPLLLVEPQFGNMEIGARVCLAGKHCKPGFEIEERGPDAYFISAGLLRSRMRVSGRIAKENPVLFAAAAFLEVLTNSGIEVHGEALDAAAIKGFSLPATPPLALQYRSAQLRDIVRITNKESLNLYAEMLQRTAGLAQYGEMSAEAGRRAIEEVLRKAGVDTSSASIADGSGLSRMNLLTPAAIVNVLLYAHNSRFSRSFIDSLPVAGVDGTLESRMQKGKSNGRVRAKTGSMTHVRALSGFAEAVSGETLAFSILVNNYTGDGKTVTAVLDEVCELLVQGKGY